MGELRNLVQQPADILMDLRTTFTLDGTATHDNDVDTRKIVLSESEVFANQTLHQIALKGLAKIFFANDQAESRNAELSLSGKEDKRAPGKTIIRFGKDPLKVAGILDSAGGAKSKAEHVSPERGSPG